MLEFKSIKERNKETIEKIKKKHFSINNSGEVLINQQNDESYYDSRARQWKLTQENADNLEKLIRCNNKISNHAIHLKSILISISIEIKNNESLFDSKDVAIFNKINNDYFPSIITYYLHLSTLQKEEKEKEILNSFNEIEKKLHKMTSFFEEQNINKLDKILSLSNYMVNL